MTDLYAGSGGDLLSPSANCAAITKSDSADLPISSKAIYVGVSGDITLTLVGQAGTAGVLFKSVPVGILPVRAARVWSTGTTATNMVALY